MIGISSTRLGLIRARLAGARLARGDVLVFLDAHCEANIGWIEPLLARIQESHSSVLVPIIDVIDAKDFHYSFNGYKNFQVNDGFLAGEFVFFLLILNGYDRSADSLGMVTLIGSMCRPEKRRDCRRHVVNELKFVQPTAQPWLEVCLRYHASTFGTLDRMTNKWMDGEG